MLCTHCNIDKPLKDFRAKKQSPTGYIQPCKACFAKKQREHRVANLEQVRKKEREYYAKNSKKIIAQVQASYQKHAEARKKRGRMRYAEDLERFQREARERRAADPEKARARVRTAYRNNPSKVRLVYSRRQARKRGLPNTFTLNERMFMLQYWGYACAVCGNQEGFTWTLALDHWIPLASPGCPGTVATNMIPLCHGERGCNNGKRSKEPHAWLVERYGKRKASIILKKIATYFAIVQSRATLGESAAD